jgi:hypothetical protein
MWVWLMLLTPSAAIGVAAVLRRTSVWLLVLSFSLTTVVVALAESYYTVFILGRFDGLFRNSPGFAFWISVFSDAITSILGVLLFGVTVWRLRPKEPTSTSSSTRSSICAGSLLGAVYITGLYVFYWSHIDTYVEPPWLLFFPVVAARLALHRAIPR